MTLFNLFGISLNPFKDRRRIEQEAFSGNLLGIIATNALELGIDIGELDAVIMLGFPMSLASFVSKFFSSSPPLKQSSPVSANKREERGAAPEIL